MQQGSARPLAVKYITLHGRRQSDHGEPSSCRLRLIPGSDAAPEALKRDAEAARQLSRRVDMRLLRRA